MQDGGAEDETRLRAELDDAVQAQDFVLAALLKQRIEEQRPAAPSPHSSQLQAANEASAQARAKATLHLEQLAASQEQEELAQARAANEQKVAAARKARDEQQQLLELLEREALTRGDRKRDVMSRLAAAVAREDTEAKRAAAASARRREQQVQAKASIDAQDYTRAAALIVALDARKAAEAKFRAAADAAEASAGLNEELAKIEAEEVKSLEQAALLRDARQELEDNIAELCAPGHAERVLSLERSAREGRMRKAEAVVRTTARYNGDTHVRAGTEGHLRLPRLPGADECGKCPRYLEAVRGLVGRRRL